jgi:8-oxo-dGTP pyrophosphatase MutT (NUDIX family)
VEAFSTRLLHFDPNREVVTPRHAATVVIVRHGSGGALEVLAVLRHPKSGFLGGALVFPGGKLDPADLEGVWGERATGVDARAASFASEGATALGLAVAACREAIEEAGVLPLGAGSGAPPDAAAVRALRAELAAGAGLATALAGRSLRLETHRLTPFARWVTPEAESRRFDARFFLLELPEGQEASHDEHETTMSFWERPARVLERADGGEFFLAPPTHRTLELLAAARDVAGALAIAARQSLAPICPLFVADPAAPFLALPGDPTHPVPERRIDGSTRFVFRDGRLLPEEAPAAARREES